jgi:Ca-activated chloride channel homolog
MTFGRPLWLLAGAVAIAALVAFLLRSDRRRDAALARFASARLIAELTSSLSRARRSTKRGLFLAAVALIFVALAEPQIGFRWEETQRRGVDVLIALDVSRSMLAPDVAPDRLTRAKLAITDLADRLAGDRLGLIAFAGSAFLQCPLTLDHAAFQQSLDVLEPGIIPVPGSDLASALTVAEEALRSENRNVKLLVLVSDGEDLGGDAVAVAERVGREGVRVYTVGVGSAAGDLIPVPRDGGGTGFVKDESGHYVRSRLDEETLRRVAEVTGGFYEPLGPRGEGMEAVVERAIAPIPKEELASRMRRVPVSRFEWPVALGLLALAAEMLLSERRRESAWSWPRPRRIARRDRAAARTLASGGLVVLLALGRAAMSHASPARAHELFAKGEFEQALEEYRAAAESDPGDPRLDFNLGAAAYKAGRLDQAAEAFARALRSESSELQEKSFYNLGNTQFRLGEQKVETDPAQTMGAWQQSIDAYDRALALVGDDADAQHNREIARRALEELRKQQEQEQQQQPDGEPSPSGEQGGDQRPAGGQQQQQQQPGAGEEEDARNGGGHGGHSAEDPAEPGSGPGEPRPDGGGDAPAEAGKHQRANGAAPKISERADESGGRREQTATEDGSAADRAARAAAGEPGADSRAGGREGDAESAGAPAPGQLTASDARQLLDSLRGEERRVPLMAGSTRAANPNDPARRDW